MPSWLRGLMVGLGLAKGIVEAVKPDNEPLPPRVEPRELGSIEDEAKRRTRR